jgi:uncharacterized membrane protein
MEMTPLIAIHMSMALGAVATGPVALWARLGARQRPRLHRTFGYAWVTLMLATAISAIFIRDRSLPNLDGFTPIHLLVPVTLLSLLVAFWKLARGNIAGHARTMRSLYFFACVVTGAFTLLPQRFLGRLVWGQIGKFAPIVEHTPPWVWLLLAALVFLGWTQSRDRTASLGAVSALPIGMTLFSLLGMAGAFGRSPLMPEALGLWLLATGVVAALLAQRPAAAWYDQSTRRFDLAGSWVPLVLFVSVFLTRYTVAVQLVLHPLLAEDRSFTLAVVALYGAFSGVFLGRAARLWRLALRPRLALAA